MINYTEIDKLFGVPLNTIPKPRRPFEFKLWHAAVIVAIGYFAYKGVAHSIQEKSIRIRKKEG
jgi:hypothetical protein